MQTDSSRFHCCEGCELHANKLVSLMNQMDIFRNVLFSLVQMYGLMKSSDWPFFVCLPSIKQVNALNWADTHNNNLSFAHVIEKIYSHSVARSVEQIKTRARGSR